MPAKLRIGMTFDEVVEILGKPFGTMGRDASWDRYDLIFDDGNLAVIHRAPEGSFEKPGAQRSELTSQEASRMTHSEIIEFLKTIAGACTASLTTPPHLDSYEKREGAARLLGEELNKRGGFMAMKQALEKDMGWIPGCRTIEMFWDGIGDWHG